MQRCPTIENVPVLDDAPDSPALSSPARMKVLETVMNIGARVELAAVVNVLGGHPNGTRRHLDALVKEGFLEVCTKKTSASGRPAKLYTVTDTGRKVAAAPRVSSTQGRVLSLLTEHLASESNGADTARSIGRQWGEREPNDDVSRTLSEQGFAPVPGEREGEVILLACPMRDAVHADAKVACSLHRGFLEGALGADGSGVELIPFGSPRGCVVRLAREQVDD